MSKSKNGRLVWNHSTHIPGLIEVLERLKSYSGVQTITPAVIGRAKSHCPRLQIKVSVPIRGGFKLIARQGKTFQEVFILTQLNKTELQEAIAKALKLK
ncbi:MAG: metal-binding protein [Symploca sp. SIO1B1]|nr:metal-binding protein [Symploca sp. SIO2D2]NER19307.1 metal-binding protein [Symploca sp. SIO1C2]NES00694.1 metal-binding protein [Symploca sp. SIO1B1]